MPEQDQRLRDFVNNIKRYADLERYSSKPVIVRKTNPVVNKTVAIVASKTEPHDILLPLNVLWIQFNMDKPDFLTVYRRESKNSQQGSDYVHTWNPVTEYESLFEDQFYDSGDDILPDNPDAGTSGLGLVRLTVAPTNPSDPVVIAEGDSTLTDARVPLPHEEMHEEVPATRLATTGRAVVIEHGTPATGGTMIADHLGDSSWAQLTANSVYPGVTEPDLDDLNYGDGLVNLTLISADVVLA